MNWVEPIQPETVPPKRSPAHYLWAVLIARIYEVFPLLCPLYGGQMRLIAFITDGAMRLSIGLEDPDDLIEDLKRALKAAEKA